SGTFEEDEEDEKEEDSEEETEQITVGAEGKVFARTWYKMKLAVPLVQQYEELTGKTEVKYYGEIASLKAPLWNIKKSDFTSAEEEMNTSQLKIFNINFPISIHKLTLKEKEQIIIHLTEEEAK